MIRETIGNLVNGQDLTSVEAIEVMHEIMQGEATSAQIASFLTALRIKGERSHELAAFARVMRESAIRCSLPGAPFLVDTCGTGGDGMQTFNISTAAAIVAAGAGVSVAKHGNRSVSSRCGSSDVLEALGVDTSSGISAIQKGCRFAFLYAPLYHPAMRFAAGPRQEIGIRTAFNLLGPLANPAGATAQVLGVYSPALTGMMAEVLKILGTDHAMVVHGDGLDELTTTGESQIAELHERVIREYTIDCREYGIERATIGDLKGSDAQENAGIIIEVLEGEKGAPRDIVILNAGAAIYVGGRAGNLADGIRLGAISIDSGEAMRQLELLRNVRVNA
ncbi:MAG: anthranilate phosphoribosyltransferase [Methanoregulaceae archaeon]|nr:anthranilate phosphoribosyltransferase [Methanoregulaceae archaeon]